MGIFRRALERMGITRTHAAPASTGIIVSGLDKWQIGQPQGSTQNVQKFTVEGYRQNIIIFSCIQKIATSLAGVEPKAMMQVGDEDRQLPEDHMLSRLLWQPNPIESWQIFAEKLWTNCEVAGNAYIYKSRARSGMPLELRLMRPDLVKPIPGPTGDIQTYQFGEVAGTTIPASEVIQVMNHPDPLMPNSGLSPIAVLARAGDLDNYALDYLRAFFLNAGVPTGMMIIKHGKTTREEKERLRQEWRDKFSGSRGWHDIAVLDSESAEYQELGSKLDTMRASEIFGQTESRICAAFGVPPIIVGSYIGLLRSTYSNYETARKSFWTETLMPKLTKLGDMLTAGLAAEFGTNLYIDWELQHVDVLQEKSTDDDRNALDGWERGLLTRNEARLKMGYDPAEDGDVYKQKATDMYLSAGSSEEPEEPVEPPDEGIEDEMKRTLQPAESSSAGGNGHHERHETRAPEWKTLHRIADGAEPRLKKKFYRQSRRSRQASRWLN